MDKYLEKMILVPLERWEKLLDNERVNRKDDIAEVSSQFPIVEGVPDIKKKDDKNVDSDNDDDKKLAPPGIPDIGSKEILTDSEDDEPLIKIKKKKVEKKNKKKKQKIGMRNIFQWKQLP